MLELWFTSTWVASPEVTENVADPTGFPAARSGLARPRTSCSAAPSEVPSTGPSALQSSREGSIGIGTIIYEGDVVPRCPLNSRRRLEALPAWAEGHAMRRTPRAISIGHYPSRRVEETLAIARELDGGIIDSLWIGDSPLIWRECWTTIALCLARTETLRLGTAVTNPLSRDWTVTASALQTLSEYSPGRIRLGIGLGDSALRRQGGRVARLNELRDAVQAIRSLLTRAALDDRPSLYWDRPVQDIKNLPQRQRSEHIALAGELRTTERSLCPVSRALPCGRSSTASQAAAATQDESQPRCGSSCWVGCAVGPEDQAWREVAPWVRSVLRHPLAFEVSAEVQAAREQIR